jgi:GT2 family glycosyltransferase
MDSIMKMSIAIPCYEMNGRGVEMLSHSLSVLKQQTFTDFEVVVSDHSVDNDIYNICQNQKLLNIKYIRNEQKRGSSSANINNAIKKL